MADTNPAAIVFWDHSGWHYSDTHTSTGPFPSLDAAIRAAHAAGFNIGGFQVTRGALPRPQQQGVTND